MKLIEIVEVGPPGNDNKKRFDIMLSSCPYRLGTKMTSSLFPLFWIRVHQITLYMHLCRAAVTKLIALNSIKDLTASCYSYQVIGCLLIQGRAS